MTAPDAAGTHRPFLVVGARPQFVKAAPLVDAFVGAGIGPYIAHTGQHWDDAMSEVFFRELDLPAADVNLGIGSATHGEQTARMLSGLEKLMLDHCPDVVIVLGDTNSTLAGALAAAKLHIPLAHVEAGLRSYNRAMPEEVNRVLTDHVSDLLFAPTQQARRCLEAEGITGDAVRVVGDVMFDAFRRFSRQYAGANKVEALNAQGDVAREVELLSGSYVLATVHRAENTDDRSRLAVIVEAFCGLSRSKRVVLPLHPRTAAALAGTLRGRLHEAGVVVIAPVGYRKMLALERDAAVIATDSGGVQKEAFFCKVPCVTIREETEWVELVESGWNRLCPPRDPGLIARSIESAVGSRGTAIDLYGSGNAAELIVQDVLALTVA